MEGVTDDWKCCTDAEMAALYAVYKQRCLYALPDDHDHKVLASIDAEIERRHPGFYKQEHKA